MAKIMVVDDSPDLLLLISIIIKREGHQAISLTSPVDLLQKLDEHNPDLIILDVNIGAYNGKEVCKNIKANLASKNIPVLLTSASSEVLIDFKDYNGQACYVFTIKVMNLCKRYFVFIFEPDIKLSFLIGT